MNRGAGFTGNNVRLALLSARRLLEIKRGWKSRVNLDERR